MVWTLIASFLPSVQCRICVILRFHSDLAAHRVIGTPAEDDTPTLAIYVIRAECPDSSTLGPGCHGCYWEFGVTVLLYHSRVSLRLFLRFSVPLRFDWLMIE